MANRGINHNLTPVEMKIMDLMSKGYDNQRIGTELGITKRTTENYCNHIYEKLGIQELEGYNPRVKAVLEYLAWVKEDVTT